GNTHVFSLRVTNNSANLYNTSNGFRVFSDDGATWTTTTGAWLNNFDDLFTNVYINPFDVDGAGSDTIGFAGVSFGAPDGLPPGYNDLAFQITIGPTALADVGKHICIDSSWYRPGGTWKWADLDTQNPPVYPDWSGQKCYRIMDPVSAESQQVTLAGVTNTYQDTCLLVGNTHVFSLRVTNNSANLYNTTNGFRIFSDDGATWTTTTGAWLNRFEDNFDKDYINPFSIDGTGSDTIGFAGVSFGPPNGLPPGYDDLAFQIAIGPTALADVGKHICIDSSWYRPGGTWKWAELDTQNSVVYPDWSGQKCFQVIDLGTDVQDQAGSGLPTTFALAQNYPNPFNPTCIIKFDVPHRATLTLKVFNILGQEVATLVNGSVDAGYHQVEWDASAFGSGVYFYRLEADDGLLSTKKMVVLK
ncbi:MAG: T9SS type A sorting domain-containing protein, partial [Candidatus Zixiibacteriota bacterium]